MTEEQRKVLCESFGDYGSFFALAGGIVRRDTPVTAIFFCEGYDYSGLAKTSAEKLAGYL